MTTMNKKLLIPLFLSLFLAQGVLAVGKPAIPPGQAKKVLMGSVEGISSSSLTLEEKTNRARTEGLVDSSTQVIGPNRKLQKLGTLKLKDTIAMIATDSGTATAGSKLKIKKIFVKDASASASALLKRHAVMGVITAINGDTITLAHQIQSDRVFTVLVTPQTIIKLKSESLSKSATPSASPSQSPVGLAVGQRIVAVGTPGDKGLVAKLIHIIPGLAAGVPKPQPSATPSATLTPTLSVSPTSTLSPTPTATPTPSPVLTPTPSLIPSPT